MSAWINQIFKAGQVNKGNIVRRAASDVQKYASQTTLMAEVKKRHFHLVRSGDQFLIICNDGHAQLLL